MALWGIAGQAVSSVSNLILAVLAARELATDAFGAFSAALAAYLLSVGLGRALCGEVLSIRHTGAASADDVRAATGASVVVGIAAASAVVVAGLSIGGTATAGFIALAACLPGLLLHDALRYVAVARGRAERAFALDAAWTAGALALFAAVTGLGDPGVADLVLAWGVPGAAVGIVAGVRAGAWPAPRAGLGWLRRHRDLGPRLAAELGVTFGAWQLALTTLGAVAGIAAMGATRGVQVLYGPLTVLLVGSRFVVVPQGAHDLRAAGLPAATVVRRSASLAAVTSAAGALLVVALAALPDFVGEALLGATWPAASALVVPFGLFMLTESAVNAAAVGLRALGAAGASLRAAMLGAAAMICSAGFGGAAGGARAAAWALAGTGFLTACTWWLALWRTAGSWYRPDASPAQSPDYTEVPLAR